ncbi:cytochrome bd-type ubiquinol oxidase subunit I [Geobacillus sp. C56-T3]|nr:cytochrome bd-type ubiquinol oxidase subunit I [Geobacillus sp. C56-T3]ADU93012.1 cytochrome bd-type ubiquinol oxidase subunit I [Geobacillus sp. Y412MC52]ALA70891.1 cytochrome BD oxidase subunit I [Geobacillus stearothermophilus 10]
MREYDPVWLSRVLTELTLTFHIIYATIGVGIPLMIAIAQWVGIRSKHNFSVLVMHSLPPIAHTSG